jgi:hypothetical protein
MISREGWEAWRKEEDPKGVEEEQAQKEAEDIVEKIFLAHQYITEVTFGKIKDNTASEPPKRSDPKDEKDRKSLNTSNLQGVTFLYHYLLRIHLIEMIVRGPYEAFYCEASERYKIIAKVPEELYIEVCIGQQRNHGIPQGAKWHPDGTYYVSCKLLSDCGCVHVCVCV